MTISTTDTLSSGSDLQTYTFSGTDIGSAAENRVVYAMVSARKSGTAASTLSSVTINGVAANIIRQTGAAEASGYNVMAIVAAVVPTGTSVDVVVQWSTSHARCGGIVATSYDSLPDVVETAEATGTGTITPGLSAVSDGVTLAMALVFSSSEALSPTTGATSLGSAGPESNPRLYIYETTEPFSATTNGSTYTPIVIEATFPAQTLPAIRPHQKTLLHLRDSTQLDFGPERQTLTNDGVTVADDVFAFDDGDSIAFSGLSLSGKRCLVSFWVNRLDANNSLVLSDNGGAGRYAFAWNSGSGGAAFNNATANEVWIDAVSIGSSPSQSTMHNNIAVGEWVHIAADVSFDASVWEDVQIGAYPASSTFNFDGELADFRICEYTPTAGEMFDLYANGRGYDLPERRQLPDTVVHLLDGSTDAGFHGEEITLDNVTYNNGVYTFAGTTPHIDFGQTRVFNELDGFAFACFFNVTDMDQRRFLWCHGTATYLELNGATTLRYKASDNTLRFRSYAFTPGQTYHLAVSVEGGVASVYIDGVFDGTIAVSGTSTFSVSQFSTANATFMFEGDMWDNRMFDRPISASEVANLYRKGIPSIRRAEVLRIDPARYSGSGDLIDQTGGGNDGTLVGSAAVTDGAIVLADDGASRVTLPTTGMDKTKGTIAFWWRPDSTSANWRYFTDNPSGARIVFLQSESGNTNKLTMSVDGRSQVTTSAYTLTADTWHHLAATWDTVADEFLVYVDGEAVSMAAASGTLGANALGSTMHLGANNTLNHVLDGDIDKFLVANEVYTADQIAFLASSREFSDPFPEPFGNLGGEETSIHPERHGLLINEPAVGSTGQGAPTLQGNAAISDGGITMAGGSDRILLNDFALSSSGLPFTVSMWVTRLTGNATMWSSKDGGGTYYMGLAAGGGSSASFGYSNMKHYVNGVNLGSSPTRSEFTEALPVGERVHVCLMGNSSTNQGTGFQIGKYNNNTGLTLNGSVEDVRVFKRQLTPSEVAVLYNDGTPGVELPNTRDAKLAVLPSYDDASSGGTSVLDYSGNQNTGTFVGSPTWDTSDNLESGTRALSFNGSANYVNFGQTVLTENLSQLSLVVWMLATDTADQKNVIGRYKASGETRSLILDVQGSGQLRFVSSSTGSNGGTSANATSGLTSVEGRWVPVVVTFDGPDVTFHVAGETESETGQSLILDVARDFLLGAVEDSSDYFDGLIDDVLVYDRVLTPAEIARFSERRNIFGEPFVAPPVTSSSIPSSNQLLLLGCF